MRESGDSVWEALQEQVGAYQALVQTVDQLVVEFQVREAPSLVERVALVSGKSQE